MPKKWKIEPEGQCLDTDLNPFPLFDWAEIFTVVYRYVRQCLLKNQIYILRITVPNCILTVWWNPREFLSFLTKFEIYVTKNVSFCLQKISVCRVYFIVLVRYVVHSSQQKLYSIWAIFQGARAIFPRGIEMFPNSCVTR